MEYDNIDMDNMVIIIQRCNLKKYLKEYNCIDEDDFVNCLWINYGIVVQIVN
jgi:hypothetical protein